MLSMFSKFHLNLLAYVYDQMFEISGNISAPLISIKFMGFFVYAGSGQAPNIESQI
jgi:hypothetical protein